jgi:O-antigen ligase
MMYHPHRFWIYAIGIVFSVLAALVVWKVHPLAAVGLPLAVMILWAYLYWRVTGPMFFTIALFLRPGEMIHPIFDKLKVGKLTAGACLAFWFFHFVFIKRRHVPRDILTKLMIALTCSIIICSIKSTVPTWSQQFLSEVWIKLVILFFAIASLLTTTGSLSVYVAVMNGLTIILSLMGIHKGLTAPPELLVEGNRVGLGTLFGDPNDYAQMLLTCGVAYFMQAVVIAPRRIRKAFFIVCLMITIGGVFFARSRGGFLGFAGCTMTVMKGHVSTKTLLVSGGGLGVLGVIFMKIADRATAHSADGGVDESAQGRLDAWKAAVRMFLKNPLFGVGYECYPWNYLAYVSNPVDWKPKAVHSSWFKALAELGLSGCLFFYAIIFFSLKRSYEFEVWAKRVRLRQYGLWYIEAIYRSFLPAFVSWCITGTFLSNSFTWFLYISIAVLIAATAVQTELDKQIQAGELMVLPEYA